MMTMNDGGNSSFEAWSIPSRLHGAIYIYQKTSHLHTFRRKNVNSSTSAKHGVTFATSNLEPEAAGTTTHFYKVKEAESCPLDGLFTGTRV
jgi:hypothetical protein